MKIIPLQFVGDAICLSGRTGTKLKCAVIRDYYSFWWGITSGGESRNHCFNTAIVEMNAATGLVYLEDTDETILGSSGHAIELKINNDPDTSNLKIVLIEEDDDCYTHLKNVFHRCWSAISIPNAEGPPKNNNSNIFLIKKPVDEALVAINEIANMGNALFFFDPLRNVSFCTIEDVARSRIKSFLKTGTEFFVFVFTSDWFLGRKDFAALPQTIDEAKWTKPEKATVESADDFFGGQGWRQYLLNDSPIESKEESLIRLYQFKLQKWFRYVLPLPFKPKMDQVFHLVLCSNYHAGVRATRDFYCSRTGNPKYSPDNDSAFKSFKGLHPSLFPALMGRERPLEWKILWKTIREHGEGLCDAYCPDFEELESANWKIQDALDWLERKDYIEKFPVEHAWNPQYVRYQINWKTVGERLHISPPNPLVPLSPGDA